MDRMGLCIQLSGRISGVGALFMGKIPSVDGYRRLWVSVANGREDAGCQLVVNTENSRKDLWELESRTSRRS